MAAWRAFVLVLLPFAAGYFLSYVFRTINALIAGELTHELGLSPADLGLLTSVYFLAMAGVQIPLGILLDRHGPRRVQSCCLVFAAVGAVIFACATSMLGLIVGRVLIGVGVATALMASLKAIVLWFPKERIALANGWVVMLGALGAVTATLPAESLIEILGWRGLFFLLAGATVLCALAIHIVVPGIAPASAVSGPARVKLRDIYRDARFLRLAPLSTLCIGTAWSLQGLWAAPWLAHVEGLARPTVVRHLLIMGVALSVGAILLGWSADRLRRRGISRETFLAVIAIAFMAAQLALAARTPISTYVSWAIIAAVGAATVLSFAILPEYFPKEMSARANAALNILHLAGAFVLQYVTGVVVSLWPTEGGHPPAEAYQAAIALGVILQSGALVWFLATARAARAPIFRAGWPATGTAGATQHPAMPIDYVNAQLVLAQHVARARSQAAQWRRIGVASAGLCVCLGLTLAMTAQSHVFAHVVEASTGAMAMHPGEHETAQAGWISTHPEQCTIAGIVIVGLPSRDSIPATCNGAPRPTRAEFVRVIYTQGQ